MKNIKLIILEEIEQNPSADVSRCNTGGGYFQPYIKGLIRFKNKSLQFVLSDTNCGDFGNRYTLDIYDQNNIIYSNSVDEVGKWIGEYNMFWSGEYQNVLDWVCGNTFLTEYIR